MSILTVEQFHALVKPKKKANKYGAHKTEYEGRVYHSKAEATYAGLLDLELRAGLVEAWWPQVGLELHAPNGKRIGKYIADFKVLYASGRLGWIEVKGFDTALSKWKRKHCSLEHNIVIEVVKKVKNSK